jgi:Tol biopolymer transport system component
MMRKATNPFARIGFCLLIGELAAGCGAAKPSSPTPIPTATFAQTTAPTSTWTPTLTLTSTLTPTPTQIPVKDRDLSAIVLQKTEIPDYYTEKIGYLGPSCMQVKYPGISQIHENLVAGFNKEYVSVVDLSFYDSSIFVYPDEKTAQKAYLTIVIGWPGDVVDIPDIGSESHAYLYVDLQYGMYLMELVWRDGETVLELTTFAVRKPDTDEMVKLAQGIQRRLEEPPSPKERTTPPIGGGSGQLAYISDGMIVRVNADGSSRTCIVNHNPISFSFSPDGRRIAYVLQEKKCPDSGPCEETDYLYIANADGTDTLLLDSGWIADPVWSPDGKKLAFRIDELVPYTTNSVTVYLMIMDLGQNNQRKFDNAFFGKHSWSPDGKMFAYSCYDGKDVEICTIDDDENNSHFLTNNLMNDYFIGWSPDGKKILFQSNSEETGYGLSLMNSDGSQSESLIRKNDFMYNENWSPDGKKVAYYFRYHGDIYSIEIDSRKDTQLTEYIGQDDCPVWSADSRKIIFITQRDGPREIFIMNEDGSDEKLLAWMGGEVNYCPVWVPG